ncbi:ubiquitin-specific protease otu1 [Coemansia sp. RSA 2530]|nr:ubiquitin-specific protease otu1 [Coemansia sp. RSA 2530]
MQLHLKAEGRDGDEGQYGGQTSTFGEFRRRLAQVSSLPLETLRIKAGDPPEFIDFPDSTPLADTPIAKNCSVYAVRGRMQDTSGPEATSGTAATTTAEHTPHTCENCASAAAQKSLQERRSEPETMQLSRLHNVDSSFDTSDKSTPEFVAFRDGYLVRRSGILDNPEQYNEAVLEKPIPEYCHWISQPSSWGGGIEMAILSETFSVEICSIDIQSLRVDRFGEDKYVRRVILLYSGIHYDYVAYASGVSAPRDFDQTEFGVVMGADDVVLAAAVDLAASLRGSRNHYHSSLARVKCNECSQIVHGESEARLHATTTGHLRFVQA